MEKLITFKIESQSGGWLIGEEATDLLVSVFGCEKDGKIRAETIKSNLELEDDEEITYTIKVEKRYTRKELDEMPESDGDID